MMKNEVVTFPTPTVGTSYTEALEKHKELIASIHKEAFEICVEVDYKKYGKLPTKAHKTDAGFDLYATEDIKLYPGQVRKHPLNIKMQLPKGTWAEITTKSGLGAKGQLVYAGVIDEAYRGVPHVVMTNVKFKNDAGYDNLDPIIIMKGSKVAQLIINPYNPNYYLTEVDQVNENTERGSGGFGSTGDQ
jgi:dUTP pyrophosphatase